MNEGDLALDGATDEDLIGVANSAGHLEDAMAARMGPPAATDAFARDGLSERGNRSLRRFEYDAVVANEGECFPWSHLFSSAPPSM